MTDDLFGALDLHPNERVWYSAPRALPALRILHARDSGRLWKVWHETFSICTAHAVWDAENGREGCASWGYRGQQLITARGGLMLMEPGECHVTQRVEGVGTFDVLQIDPSYIEEVASELDISGPVHLRTMATEDPALRRAANGLLEDVLRAEGRLEQEHALEQVVRALILAHSERKRPRVPTLDKVQLRRAVDYIVANHSEDFGVEELARGTGASISSVCHGLKHAIGVTPMELRNLVRIARAQRLLVRGERPIDVANTVGFCDQASLTRHFKAAWAVTPGAYARSVRRST